jgi:hypothetical protein
MNGLRVFLAMLTLLVLTGRPSWAAAYEMTPDLANKLTFGALTAKPPPPPPPRRRASPSRHTIGRHVTGRHVTSRHGYSSHMHPAPRPSRHNYVRKRTSHRPLPAHASRAPVPTHHR